MPTTFSAAPQAVGYLYQLRYALYALLSQTREEAAVIVEGLDDVEIVDSAGSSDLRQLKHVQADLTNTSSEIWKTLRIWASQLRSGIWDSSVTRLNLVTISRAAKGSAAWYLKAGEKRDERKARELLIEAARQSKTEDKSLRSSFEAFEALTNDEQTRLMSSISVLDESEDITDIVSSIKRQLRFAAPPGGRLLDELFEQLEGWWFNLGVRQLVSKSRSPIQLLEVQRKVWSITEQLREENLPIEYASAIPNDAVDPSNDDRLFVQQLRVLQISDDRIKRAILDYYRAFEQRASWVRNQLLIDDNIGRYENRLVDEWEGRKLRMEDELLSRERLESECLKMGQQLLGWMETEANIKIRPGVEDRFVLRGSYHILANTDVPRVYWHPRFLERLSAILKRT